MGLFKKKEANLQEMIDLAGTLKKRRKQVQDRSTELIKEQESLSKENKELYDKIIKLQDDIVDKLLIREALEGMMVTDERWSDL